VGQVAGDASADHASWRAVWGEDAPSGDVGTRLVTKNDRVRVWEIRLAPGETSPLHTHWSPYLFVVTSAARVLTRYADGTSEDELNEPGDVVYVDVDHRTRTHTLSNIDDKQYENRVVELLR
jgi:beta-alanine degradation protein BauB